LTSTENEKTPATKIVALLQKAAIEQRI